jgi:excisionase family DNA binding protein
VAEVEFLTVDEAATLLKRHPSTIYRRLERGEWPFAFKEGKDWRIERGALLEHLKARPIHTRRQVEDPMPRPRSNRRARFQALLEQTRGVA